MSTRSEVLELFCDISRDLVVQDEDSRSYSSSCNEENQVNTVLGVTQFSHIAERERKGKKRGYKDKKRGTPFLVNLNLMYSLSCEHRSLGH